MKLKIKVTKEILKKSKMCGLSGDLIGNSCAISLACQELFTGCYVSDSHIASNYNYRLSKWTIHLPQVAKDFIYRFDALKYTPSERLELPELEFEVELTEEVLNTINISEAREALKGSKTLELIW